ncbi:geranylgeranyl reductase [Perilla frutescens var. hirtella]|uniref:Geranylgeranyl reductase n=1 Tax=Perilla frutescens var. hirtella TaxID=608512 RepID=A0AAD4IZW3_PERFH|nr:geranylgeranyl reductase [Perilla frutescens var. hirtella]
MITSDIFLIKYIYIYIEEDDDAPFRRGREQACNHTVYGEDMTILAGDALLSCAFQHIVLHTPTQLVTDPQLVRVIAEIALSADLLIHHVDKKLS